MRAAASWKAIRKQKIAETNGHCEDCRQDFSATPRKLVLHHVINRRAGGKHTYENSRLRCETCETHLHRVFRDGNHPGAITPWNKLVSA